MKYIFANWKQHFSYSETIQKFSMFLQELDGLIDKKSVTVGVAVSHESIKGVCKQNRSQALLVGAQSCSSFYQGSYTGGVAARSLQEIGSNFVFIGHSERRRFFKETENDISLQMKNAVKAGLTPILCIGELLEDKEKNRSVEVLRLQIMSALKEVDDPNIQKKLLIAYEPQYAIGTGVLPELKDIAKTMASLQNIKNEASLNLYEVPLLYGGSIDEKNYSSVMKIPFVDGFLVGRASLHIQTFKQIVAGCAQINKKYVSGIDKNYNVVENI